jgi:hypothetical protein
MDYPTNKDLLRAGHFLGAIKNAIERACEDEPDEAEASPLVVMEELLEILKIRGKDDKKEPRA